MTAEPLELRNPLAEWQRQLRRSLDGDVIAPADVVEPQEIRLGYILRSGTRRYADSEVGIGLGGMVYDGDATAGWKVVEVKANTPPSKGTRIEWHTIAADEIDWLEYKGHLSRTVIKDLQRMLVRHMRGREDDRRYMAALNVIAFVLS